MPHMSVKLVIVDNVLELVEVVTPCDVRASSACALMDCVGTVFELLPGEGTGGVEGCVAAVEAPEGREAGGKDRREVGGKGKREAGGKGKRAASITLG